MIVAALGLAAAMTAGLLLAVAGWRGVDTGAVASDVGRVGYDRRVRRAAAAATGGAVGWWLTGWPVAAVTVTVAVWVAPDLAARAREGRRQLAVTDAVASWTEQLRDTIAAVAGIEEAIVATAARPPAPLAAPLRRLRRRRDRGVTMPVALHAFADEVADPAADLVVQALVAATRHQAGELAGLLSALADNTRLEAQMRRRVATSRVQRRTHMRMLFATTGLFAAGLLIFAPDFLAAYRTAAGQVVLSVLIGMLAAAAVAMDRLGRVHVPDRLLTRQDDGR